VEAEAQGKSVVWEKQTRPFSFTRLDIPIDIFEVNESLEIPVKITITEKDRVFPDRGEQLLTISVPENTQLPRTYTATIEVSERRFVFWKTKAVFHVGIDVRAIPEDSPKLRAYESYNGEDYNRYDEVIREVVAYWNDEFTRLTEAPIVPLDPSLVKAIAYQESRVGNHTKNNGKIDILQVGNAGDPALTTLRGGEREYWVHDGNLVQLKYPSASVESVRDSIFWGVRWLYHKAHENVKNPDGSWKTKWKSWQEAVHGYGPGVDEYSQNVWNIYTKGIDGRDKNTIRLWSFTGLLILILTPLLWSGFSDTDIQKEFVKNFVSSPAEHWVSIDVTRHPENNALFAVVKNDSDNWFEEMAIGRLEKGKITWFPDLPVHDVANGILSVRWLNLKGFGEPILEVLSQTHMGNGTLGLYRVVENELVPLARISAVDNYRENIFDPSGYPQYGSGYYSCSSIYTDGKLDAVYRDETGDGIDDAVLTGIRQTFCEKNWDDAPVLVDEQPIREVYELTDLEKELTK